MSTARQLAYFCAMLAVVVASMSLWTSDAVVSFAAQQVPAACVPPEFGDPPIIRPFDRATTGCDLDGEASASDPTEAAKQAAQNVMKNEFCAWTGATPALVTRFSFDQLQKRLPAGFPWGSRTNMPTAEERKAIREFYTTSEGDTIGEGSYVVFVAYLLEGHFTPTSGNPPRRSGWEIHPVYSIEVCEFKTLATCRSGGCVDAAGGLTVDRVDATSRAAQSRFTPDSLGLPTARQSALAAAFPS